jgi:hypothetical protein
MLETFVVQFGRPISSESGSLILSPLSSRYGVKAPTRRDADDSSNNKTGLFARAPLMNCFEFM